MAKSVLVSVVDDDESVRESIESLIRSVGFTVQTFPSAKEFLQNGPIEKTACLILDVRMPGMSGLELQRDLVAAGRQIPIVFITGHGDEEARVRALKDGAVDFLSKPFSEEALLKAVNTALTR